MPSVERPRSGLTSIGAIVGLELRLHSRDFMALLGALVFFFLALSHASGGPISLVSGTLALEPRNSARVLAQAMAGLTAFGQVITAMTAATVGLRDVALRSEGMVLTTGIEWRDYLLGRFVATLVVLLGIYAAMPLGFILGGAAVGDLIRPMLVLVLPNVVLVSVVFFAAAALSGGFAVILLVGLGFIALWQTGLGLVTRGEMLGALIDPFGNAALTVGHSLGANRAVWLVLSALLLGYTLWRWQPSSGRGLSGLRSVGEHAAPRPLVRPIHAVPSQSATAGAFDSLAQRPPLRGANAIGQWNAEYRFGLHWVLRERGFAVLLLLALLNAVANGWSVADEAPALVRALEFHARLFAILIATIYAGELVWRDRDERVDALLNALPTRPNLRLGARSAGVLTGLLALPLATALAGIALPLLRGGHPDSLCTVGWLGGVGSLMFGSLFLVSLLTHRVVQHKTAAHLLLIAAWVTAIAAGADALAQPWQDWGHCG